MHHILLIILLPFHIDKESKSPYSLTSSTHVPANFSSFLSGSIVTVIPTVTQGK